MLYTYMVYIGSNLTDILIDPESLYSIKGTALHKLALRFRIIAILWIY